MSEAIQRSFADALGDPDHPIPKGMRSGTGARPERRFRVYRNNIVSGLVRTLSTKFPAAERIVGSDFFTAMAQTFVRTHPPHSPLLFDYGTEFAEFVEGFEPAVDLAYLPDVIRLETARGKAYHAADETPIESALLASFPRDRLPEMGLLLHPSASVIRSAHPVVTIWAMNSGEAVVEPILCWKGEDALVTRPALTVLVSRLPPGGAFFVESLRAGARLGAAIEVAIGAEPAFDLTSTLTCTLRAGLFTTVAA